MAKVKNLNDLRQLRDALKSKLQTREKGLSPEKLIQIKVSMATCGIAAGAKEVMMWLIDELDRKGIDALVTQTGCMGYCYAEPTIEVTLPGEEPVVFGNVNTTKASEIVDSYVQHGVMVDGVIPVTYKTPE